MPHYVVDKLARSLDERAGRGLRGAKILMIGIAYKKNVDDIRESPAFKLIELLEERGAAVDFYDPYVQKIPSTRKHADACRAALHRLGTQDDRRLRRGLDRDRPR